MSSSSKDFNLAVWKRIIQWGTPDEANAPQQRKVRRMYAISEVKRVARPEPINSFTNKDDSFSRLEKMV